MTDGTCAPPRLQSAPLQPYASRHRPLRSCHLSALDLTTLRAQGTEQGTIKERGGANWKFHVIKFMDPEVQSKGQTKGYEPTVDHLKSLWTQKSTFKVDGPNLNPCIS